MLKNIYGGVGLSVLLVGQGPPPQLGVDRVGLRPRDTDDECKLVLGGAGQGGVGDPKFEGLRAFFYFYHELQARVPFRFKSF